MDNAREVKYDFLRICASFLVVMLHVSGSYWSCIDIYSNEFVILTIFNGVSRCAVPLFIMLSGRLLLNPAKQESLKNTVRRCVKLLVTFGIWSAFYACQSIVYQIMTGKNVDKQMLDILQQRFFRGHYHMWYLIMLIGLYLIIPICRQIVINQKATEYFLILCLAFHVIAPCLGLEEVTGRVYFPFTSYMGYFIAGYYLGTLKTSKRCRGALYASGMGGVIYIIVMTLVNCRKSGVCTEAFFYVENIGVILYSVAVFVLFSNMTVSGKNSRYSRLAGYTLFIYLFHPFVIEKLNLLGINVIMASSIVTVPAFSICIWIVSACAAGLINKILWGLWLYIKK